MILLLLFLLSEISIWIDTKRRQAYISSRSTISHESNDNDEILVKLETWSEIIIEYYAKYCDMVNDWLPLPTQSDYRSMPFIAFGSEDNLHWLCMFCARINSCNFAHKWKFCIERIVAGSRLILNTLMLDLCGIQPNPIYQLTLFLQYRCHSHMHILI